MTIRLLHGSKKNDLTQLEAQFIGGNNGSQDGVGINLTDSISLARHYAGSEGSVYMIDTDTTDYLSISSNHFLSQDKADILAEKLSAMHEMIRYRLATDICGKLQTAFKDDSKAEEFYKEKRKEYRSMNVSLDRLKPEIDYNDEGDMVILHAQTDFSNLHKASTYHIHRCLNRLDNELASGLLKLISKGLILERDNGTKNYLSFAYSEPVVEQLNHDFLSKPEANSFIKESMKEHSNKTPQHSAIESHSATLSL